jgi:hypothetical protein
MRRLCRDEATEIFIESLGLQQASCTWMFSTTSTDRRRASACPCCAVPNRELIAGSSRGPCHPATTIGPQLVQNSVAGRLTGGVQSTSVRLGSSALNGVVGG